MIENKVSVDLDDLIARAMSKRGTQRTCWRTRLKKGSDLETLCAKVEKVIKLSPLGPKSISMAEIHRILVELGLDIGKSSVADHFTERCRCTRKGGRRK
jgi:hypothetical protein